MGHAQVTGNNILGYLHRLPCPCGVDPINPLDIKRIRKTTTHAHATETQRIPEDAPTKQQQWEEDTSEK